MKINWHEASTKRGLVCVVTGLLAVVFWWFGKDVQPVLAAGTFVAGGLGVALPDSQV
ncbi:hypothetical protein [Methylomonas fluvii]|uniref:Uncharacterized protein n=1 Tax=Methylomonas fluvii TaxID=1854564 RepID=A0ABR9DIK8_9GAMM|nr:hypothetical protein [Methylomonas fluvii]MBD9362939.1 hypothetical protein [Methylomonas fluvii]